MKDTLKLLGASNHTDAERSKLDYYGTDPRSTEALLAKEAFDFHIWEPCVGHHLIADVLDKHGYDVKCSDIAEYEGYAHEVFDFFDYHGEWDGDIGYSYTINNCYLTNPEDFNEKRYKEYYDYITSRPLIEGVISQNYAPEDDNNIKVGERVFYTHRNAMLIDTYRKAIDDIPEEYRKFFLAPLLYEASVHTNTSGVFKGFYKSKDNIGKFGGDAGNALSRIMGEITLNRPVLSSYSVPFTVYQEDANDLVKHLKGIDITYLDPPYNQHPYGSNYFMLNTILENKLGNNISKVSGIPDDWNKSVYNQKAEALKSFEDLVSNLDSKYLIISYNNEGFISLKEMQEMLSKYGRLTTKAIDYIAFRGSRNFDQRIKEVYEYIFILKKGEPVNTDIYRVEHQCSDGSIDVWENTGG